MVIDDTVLELYVQHTYTLFIDFIFSKTLYYCYFLCNLVLQSSFHASQTLLQVDLSAKYWNFNFPFFVKIMEIHKTSIVIPKKTKKVFTTISKIDNTHYQCHCNTTIQSRNTRNQLFQHTKLNARYDVHWSISYKVSKPRFATQTTSYA